MTASAAISVDDLTKLTDALARCIGAVIWPAAIYFLLTKFRGDIGQLISNIGEFRLKGAGIEAVVTRQKSVDAAATNARWTSMRRHDPQGAAKFTTGVTAAARFPNALVLAVHP